MLESSVAAHKLRVKFAQSCQYFSWVTVEINYYIQNSCLFKQQRSVSNRVTVSLKLKKNACLCDCLSFSSYVKSTKIGTALNYVQNSGKCIFQQITLVDLRKSKLPSSTLNYTLTYKIFYGVQILEKFKISCEFILAISEANQMPSGGLEYVHVSLRFL